MKKKNILLICLIFIFLSITILVFNRSSLKIDEVVYNFIIYFKSNNLTTFFKTITRFANVKFCVLLLMVILLVLRNLKAVSLICVTVIIEFSNLIMKYLVHRERPNILRLIKVSNYSYPSGHAMISFGIYGIIIYLIYKNVNNKIIKIVSISLLSMLILLIGISRIYLGVHYFTDVVSGYILSLIILICFTRIYNDRGNINVQTNSK